MADAEATNFPAAIRGCANWTDQRRDVSRRVARAAALVPYGLDATPYAEAIHFLAPIGGRANQTDDPRGVARAPGVVLRDVNVLMAPPR
jgi:hypothetical protein